MQTSDIWFVVPGDPEQNTGGYRYVRRLVEALRSTGIQARIHGLAGRYPLPDQEAETAMQDFLAPLPDGAQVVLDGLAMGAMPEVLQRHRGRLQLTALVHHPLADETGLAADQQVWFKQIETRALAQVGRVSTTSDYTAVRLEQSYGVRGDRIATAQPAVDDVFFSIDRPDRAEGQSNPLRLLCVGHLSPRKAQHQLVDALSTLTDLPWQCTLVGAQDRDPDYAATVIKAIADKGLTDRIALMGELSEHQIATAYAEADLFVFPSLYEGYGMVIDEALAAGLPVLSSDGGALALTTEKPGTITYPAGNVSELTDRLRSLISRVDDLAMLSAQARSSRAGIRRWSDTARDFLDGMKLAERDDPARFSGQWLETREPADHAARSEALTDTLAQWLMTRYDQRSLHEGSAPPLQLVDIGTGRGSNPAYLVPRVPVPQQWTLVEPDLGLLQAATRRVEALDAPASPLDLELSADNLESVLPADADLITASALIDLVSESWLAAFAAAIARRRAAVLVVLSYSGQFDLAPPHPSDALVQNLVNQHQHGDKGSGSALGPEATGALAQHLKVDGYQVRTTESPWCLGGDGKDAALIDMLMAGWAKAAVEQDGQAIGAVNRWLSDRRGQLTRNELMVTVGHLDLLALPEDERR